MSRSSRTRAAALTAALLALAAGVRAQQEVPPALYLSAGGDPNQKDLDLSRRYSPFNLAALGDIAETGIRTNGQIIYCVSNVQVLGSDSGAYGCPQSAQQHLRPDGAYISAYFDLSLGFAAPASDLPSVVDPIKSGLRGGGYTMVIRTQTAAVVGGRDKIWASDRSGTELLAFGVKSTDDATCLNFTARRDGRMRAGFQLLPSNSCPLTWPPGGWKGRHNAEAESYLQLIRTNPAFQGTNDPFAFWRVPLSLQRTDKFMGDFQTFAESSDHYFEVIPKYGAVIPGKSGTPQYDGWPLGLTIFYDVFYFGLPSVGNTVFWQGTIVNESAKVYGQGQTYDSLYIAIYYNPLMNNQSSAQYFDPTRSTIFHNNTGSKCAGRPLPPGSGCPGLGFAAGGAAAITVLKSPLGDLRYKLFTRGDASTNPFYNPNHPLRGDTITINHQHMCGFGSCYPNTLARSMRASFGLISSTGVNVLDGRSPADLDATTYHRIFRPQDWPNRSGEFNKYVPGVHDNKPVWDYNHDGRPDTIYADSCGTRGCVALWSDTLPSGLANNYGNISMAAIGPFRLAPGDTVGLVIAFSGAPDSARIDAAVNNAIRFYQDFYLGPEAAPPPRIVARDVVSGNRGGATRARVTLFLDSRSEDWVDPYLARLDVSTDRPNNPWLADSIAARAPNNVAAYHIFRSCDNGATYSSDADCDGDPITDPTSKWAGFGWAPYATLTATADGDLPNTFVDQNVTAGITYTYVVVTETRGARYNLVRPGPSGLVAETVEFAPALLSPLSASSTNPNVAVVYIPTNPVAGGRRAEARILARTGPTTVPFTINLVGSARTGGTYRAVFVDTLIVTQIGQGDQASSRVEAHLLRTTAGPTGASQRTSIKRYTFTRTGPVVLSGLTASPPRGDTVVARGGAGMLLLAPGDKPILATTTLTGEPATPGSFIGSPDFPFFTVAVNRAQGGTFAGQLFIGERGDTIDPDVFPSAQWLTTGTTATRIFTGTEYGDYEIVWADDPYGPRAPFNLADRAGLAAAAQASLASRRVGSTSSADTALLRVIRAADPSIPATTQLRSYKLPFTVRNTTFNRNVTVVVVQHQSSVLLGAGLDTFRVAVPEDVWVPGDVTFFVERITREVRDGQGRTVLGPDGQPLTETVDVATASPVLGCTAPRVSCDPTVGGRQPSGYIAYQPGTRQIVSYYVPIRGGEEISFEVRPEVSATDVLASGEAPDLERVHVVPNPYVFASQYERTNASRVIKFVNLPPRGRIRIYDIAGRFIQQIDYTEQDLQGGDLNWNMQTRENLELAYGLYVFVLESQGRRKIGKFVIIR